jgi:DNA-binding transcriptional LysR family regulator
LRCASAPIFAWRSSARLPISPRDRCRSTRGYLTAHDCINIRLPTYGSIYAWEFEKRGRALKVHVEGQLVFNNIALRVNAALAGSGLAYLAEDEVQEHVAEGRLVRVLADWCPPFSGYHLYYPSRRQAAPAFALLVEALRYRGSSR